MSLTGSFEGSLRCAHECTVPPWWRQHRLAFERYADTLQGFKPHIYDCVTVAKNRGLTNFCWDDFPSFRSFLNFSEIRSNYVCTEVWKTFWKTFRNLKIRYISFPLPYFSATYFISLSFLSNLHYFLERQVNVMQWFRHNSSYYLLKFKKKTMHSHCKALY